MTFAKQSSAIPRRLFAYLWEYPDAKVEWKKGAISFDDLLKELWAGRRIIAACVAVFFVFTFLGALSSRPVYTAELRVAPANSDYSQVGQQQKVISLFSAGGQTYDDYANFMSLLHSVRVADQLEKKYHLMETLFPYDKTTKQFVPPPGAMPWLIRKARELFGLPGWRPPTPVDLAQYLESVIVITRSADSTATITYQDSDAVTATTFLTRVFRETDTQLRNEKIHAREQMQRYISERLNDTTSIEQRTALIQLWSMQETQRLLLKSGDPVGARLTDEVRTPSMPSSGSLKKIGIALLLGFALGMAIVILRTEIYRA